MELREGMYVRTDNGIIGKIYEKIGDMFTYKDSNRDYITYGGLHNEILKASHNIIDLIEVGDYVNGKQVIDKWEEPFGAFAGEIFIKLAGEDTVPTMRKIENIVTKEQFESMSYKVEVK